MGNAILNVLRYSSQISSKTMFRTFQFHDMCRRSSGSSFELKMSSFLSNKFKFVLANTVNETVVVFDFVGTECDSVKNENAIWKLCSFPCRRIARIFLLALSRHLPFCLHHNDVCGSVVATIYPLRHTHLLVDDIAVTREKKTSFYFLFQPSTETDSKPRRWHTMNSRLDGNFRCGKTSGGKRFLCIRYKFDSIFFFFVSTLYFRIDIVVFFTFHFFDSNFRIFNLFCSSWLSACKIEWMKSLQVHLIRV